MRRVTQKIQAKVKTDYGAFVVVFEREPDIGGYMATVPKVADVVTWGKTLAHAKRMAKEAIECSIEGDVVVAAEKEGLVALRKQHAYV